MHTLNICPLTSLLPLDQVLDQAERLLWSSRGAQKHFSFLVDGKDAADGALGVLLQAKSADEREGWIAQKRVRQLLLGLERRVGLGRVARESEDREAGRGQVGVVVSKGACLSGAYYLFIKQTHLLDGDSVSFSN